MAYTPVFTQGVKFIKIARIDEQGKDNTLSLQEINSIRIKFSDVGVVEYPINSIAKYDNFFLFGVIPTDVTSSTDNEILNYRFSASYTRSFTSGTSYILNNYIPYGSEDYNDLSYFDMSNGRYTLGNQPNIPIIIKVSASITSSLDEVTTILYINSNVNGIVASQSYYVPTGTTRSVMTSSYTTVPTIGEYFYLSFSPGANTQFTGSYFATQSIAPNISSSDLVVLQPYIDENFFVSDYNILAGNAVEPRVNSFYMDVDYAAGVITASNQIAILSGSATRATVQESNYTTAAVINSRYIGKELNSAKLNEWTEGDISYGKTPNVSNPEVNFVSFNTLEGTSPQWGNNNVDMTQVGVNYIINANGNAAKPINDSKGINLGTIQQSFEENKNATLALDNSETSGANLTTLNGSWPIYKSGYKIEPILYTQTASYDINGNITGFGSTGSIIFVQGEQGPNVSKNDYMMYAAGTDDIITLNMTVPAGLHFSPPTFIGESGSLRDNLLIPYSGSIYNPTGSLGSLSTGGYILDFKVFLAPTTYENKNDRRGDIIVTWALQKSTNAGVSWTNLTTVNTNYDTETSTTLFFQEINATTSSLYRVAAISTGKTDNGNAGSNSPLVYLTNKSYFSVSQYPNPGTGACGTPFWTTGSAANILLASTASDGLNNYRSQKQKDISKSGFNPINLDFDPQTYDEIRFEGLEQLSFAITSVTSSATNQMIINLDKNIPNGVNLNYFLLRRYVEDPSSIILDVNFPLTDNSGSINSAGNGILKPQYITKELESGIDTIIQNLKNQNLI
jgi:hypothetical protein